MSSLGPFNHACVISYNSEFFNLICAVQLVNDQATTCVSSKVNFIEFLAISHSIPVYQFKYTNPMINYVKVIVRHIFETSIKCLCFIRSKWNFVCMFFKAFWTQLNKFRGNICILKTDFILQIFVNFWPINSKNEKYTSYYKIWGI